MPKAKSPEPETSETLQLAKEELWDAACDGDLETVKKILNEHASVFFRFVDCPDDNNATALHMACSQGHLAVVQYLIEHQHATVMSLDEYGETPLHFACARGNLHIVKYLVEQRWTNIHVRNDFGETPLHEASLEGHLHVVRYLIERKEHGANVAFRDSNGLTALHYACREGHLDVARYLLLEAPIHKRTSWDVVDNEGNSPLALAQQYKQHSVENFWKETTDSVQKLLSAVEIGDLATVQRICEDNPALSTCSRTGGPCVEDRATTPLDMACVSGHLKIVRYLIEEQAVDATGTNRKKWTPLHWACYHGQLDVVRYLLKEQSMSVHAQDTDGETALHAACRLNHKDVVRLLMEEHGASVHVVDAAGNTPLHRACISNKAGNLDVTRYLVEERDADVEARDFDDKWTGLHWCCAKGCLLMVRYFAEETNMDFSVRSESGETPLHVASRYGQLAVVQYLVQDAPPGKRVPITIKDKLYRGHADRSLISGKPPNLRDFS